MALPRCSAMLLCAALLLPLAGCGSAESGTLHIGIAGPLSRDNGRSMKLAAEMAAAEINANGGVGGRRLELVFKDDNADARHAVTVAAELRDDPRIVAVIGHVHSSATIAAAGVYREGDNAILQISPASSSPEVSRAGAWTFRVCPSDLEHVPVIARWAYERLGHRRVSVIYGNDSYGRGIAQGFTDAFAALGGSVVARDPYVDAVLDDPELFEAYLRRAIRNRAEALVIAGQADPAQRALRVARQLGFEGPVLGGDGLTALRDAGPIAEGVFISSVFLTDRPTRAAQDFVAAYQDRFGELPDHRGAMTYDAIHIVVRAIREVGTNRRAVRDYVAGIGSRAPAHEGVSGSIAFDENGDVVGKEVTMGVVRGNALRTAGLD